MTNQNDRNRDRRANAAGNNQREREQKQSGTRPWGRASALIEAPGTQRSDSRARFVPIGAVWETEGGNLKLTLEATPNQWNDPHFRRVVVVTKNEDK